MTLPSICTNGFLNCSDIIGVVIGSATQQTTGTLFMTFFWIMIFLVAMCLMFGIRLEYSMIVILPMLLTYMAYYQAFIGIGMVILLYLAIVMTYTFWIK
jgi:hypothetical protein